MKHVVQKVINAFLILTLTMFILNGVIVRPMVNGGVHHGKICNNGVHDRCEERITLDVKRKVKKNRSQYSQYIVVL